MPAAPVPGLAIFGTFENIYLFWKDSFDDPPEADDYTYELLRNLHFQMQKESHLQSIVKEDFADFEQLSTPAQGPIYLMEVGNHLYARDVYKGSDHNTCIKPAHYV